MYQFLNKYGQTLAFGLGALITVLFIVQVQSGASEFAGLSKEDQLKSGIFNLGIGSAVFLVIINFIAAVFFAFYYLATHPNAIMKTIVPIAILLGVFAISYVMSKPASEGTMLAIAQRFELTAGQEKFISAGLTTMLVLFFGAAIAFAVSEIRNFFK